MSANLITSRSELLAELSNLCERLPIPQPSWHPYAAQITSCRSDFERAIALSAEHQPALERLAALLDDRAEPSFEHDASPELTAAWRRLEDLPLPRGRHPYLDEILPALDALRSLLIALSQVTG